MREFEPPHAGRRIGIVAYSVECCGGVDNAALGVRPWDRQLLFRIGGRRLQAHHGRAAAWVGAEVRDKLIAEAAYDRAQRRGFAPNHEFADWLAAEAELDTGLRIGVRGN